MTDAARLYQVEQEEHQAYSRLLREKGALAAARSEHAVNLAIVRQLMEDRGVPWTRCGTCGAPAQLNDLNDCSTCSFRSSDGDYIYRMGRDDHMRFGDEP